MGVLVVRGLSVLGAASLAVSMGVSLPAQQPPAAPPPLVKENATVQVSEHVFVIPDDSVPAVPNVGIIVGSTATMVVDTGLGPRNAQAVLREVAKVSRNTNFYLVTTHFHPEHAAGSSAMPPGTTFVLARAQQKDLDELGMTSVATFASRTPMMGELLKDVQFRKPDTLFDHELTIDLGGVRVRLLALGATHTRGDTVAFVEGERVLFAGDIVMNRAFLAFGQYSNGQTWMSILDQLGSLNPSIIVPSHGPRGDGALIGEQRDVLAQLQARGRALREAGRPVDQAVSALTAEFQAMYPTWVGPARLAGAIRAFYGEM